MYRVHGMVKGDYKVGGYKPVAASQYFWHGYGGWVQLDANGHITIGVTATVALYGWAIFPSRATGAAAAGSAYWLSSATAGADSLYVITDLNAWFSMRLWTGGAIDVASQARVGEVVDLNGTNDGSTAGQTIDLNSTNSHDVLRVEDWDTNDTSVIMVSLNVKEAQVAQV